MRRFIAFVLVFSLVAELPCLAAVRGKSAKYVGGTISIYTEKQVDGKWDLEDEFLVFTPKKKELAPLKIAYARIDSLEYGQKVGRRLGAAIGMSLISPIGLLLLFSKKRKHFLSVGFKDNEDKLQGAVFELAKSIVPESLQTLESKSGKAIEYESDEARQHATKGD